MKKKFLAKTAFILTVSMLLSCCVFCVSAAELPEFPMNEPWNYTINFDSLDDPNWKPDNSTITNWFSTYFYLAARKNSELNFRDSYTDSEGNTVYDGVTGKAGDKYLFCKFKGGSSANPCVVYFNSNSPVGGNGYTRANGGLASGIISYEFDIRLQTVSGYDNMTGDNRGEFVVYGWKNGTDGAVAGGKRVEIARMWTTSYNTEKSWYAQYFDTAENKALSIGGSVPAGQWAKLKISVSVPDKKVRYMFCKANGEIISTTEQNFKSDADYALTSIDIFAPLNVDMSIDNLGVKKETFLYSVPLTPITDDGTNITSTVKLANDVCRGENGDTVKTVSPVVILALYNENGSLIKTSCKSVELPQKTDFGTPAEYRDVAVYVEIPTESYTAKAFIWNDFSGLRPYRNAITNN